MPLINNHPYLLIHIASNTIHIRSTSHNSTNSQYSIPYHYYDTFYNSNIGQDLKQFLLRNLAELYRNGQYNTSHYHNVLYSYYQILRYENIGMLNYDVWMLANNLDAADESNG